MGMKKIFVSGIEQISIQKPLSEEWMKRPISPSKPLARAEELNYKEYFKPLETRRYGKLIKRAIVTSEAVIRLSGVKDVDAIITGTGMGSIQDTEDFFMSMGSDSERMPNPSFFMQSTHNTIGSTLAIRTKNHCYNTTYSDRGVSFDHALYDAYLQICLGNIRHALVGSHDECTPSFFKIMSKTSYIGVNTKVSFGEASVSLILSDEENGGLCCLSGMKVLYKPTIERLSFALDEMLDEADIKKTDITAVVTGINGNPANDQYYAECCDCIFVDKTLLHYKHLFGEGFSASGLGFYVAVKCLQRGFVPSFICYRGSAVNGSPRHLVLLNHSDGKKYSLILLSSICGN